MLLASIRTRLGPWYRRYVPPAVRASVRQAYARYSDSQRDVVSVVLPIYNVEKYLPECLDSLLAQTYGTLEIIIIDDGSPDGSSEIARSYARMDSRIRIITQENGGLGNARNTGVANAHGRYLCFVDSDDTLPRDAIARMARSLHKTGSDFAVGAPLRMDASRTWTAGWVQQVHSEHRERVTFDQFPDIMKNVFACDKLFNTEFFRRVVRRFPEKIRYEDQEPTARAFVGGTFDVLTSPTYHWRIREDGTSITQQKSNPADLTDRLIVAERVSDIYAGGAHKDTYEIWLAKAIGFDLRPYFEQVPRTDSEFFEQLRSGMQALSKHMTPEIWRMVPILDRIPALAVLAGYPDDVATAIRGRFEYGWFVPTEVGTDGVRLARSFLVGMELQVPDEQLLLGPADLRLQAKVESLWWHDTVLRITGHAYITNLDFDPDNSKIEINLVSSDGVRVPLPVSSRRDDRIDVEAKDAWHTHNESGFSVALDPTELLADAAGPWLAEVTVTIGDVTRSASLHDHDPRGIGGTQPVARVRDGVRWVAKFEEGGSLQISRMTTAWPPVTQIRSDGLRVSVTVDDPSVKMLHVSCRSLMRKLDIAGKQDSETGQTRFDITLPELRGDIDLGSERSWTIEAHGGSESPRPLVYHGGIDDLTLESEEHDRVRALMKADGTLRLAQNRWWAVADDIEVDDETLTVTGRISAAGGTELGGRLAGDWQVIEADQATMDPENQTFAVRFPFNTGDTVPTTHRGFTVRLSVRLDGRQQERWLRVSHGLQHQFPSDTYAKRYGVTFTRTKKVAALWVRFQPPYRPDERGRLAQRRLHDYFRTPVGDGGGVSPEPRDAVLFESYNGRNIGDSVLAIYNELRDRDLGLDLLWSVSDLSIPVPDGATQLLIGSRAWMDALHNARYLVNNNNFPFYFRKRPEQTYVQTWHGTPLKRIGNDVPGANLSLAYRKLMQREAGYWDVLLAQNDFSAEVLPKSFGYRGRVLNVGYPRNDVLVDTQAPLRRKRVRADFGLTDDQQVILYAPTFRDNVSISTGYAVVSHLDFAAAQAATGNNTVFFLRGHVNTTHYASEQPDGVIDVSRYSDVNDLLLASDMLITDYSSIMFDYAATRKPMMFLTPDLDQYRDVTRGFYLDFEDIVPGPICYTSDEVIARLTDMSWKDSHYERYDAFVERFASRDDGEAARRVVDVLWGS